MSALCSRSSATFASGKEGNARAIDDVGVDGVGRKADGFGDSQTGRVTDGEDHAVLQIVDGRKEACHLVLAHHHGRPLRLLASGDVVLDKPREV